tara:strand:+ start:4779 stop:5375 length:597 start_codon:yes stop_codon:yes gene_type:complete
MSEIQNIKLTKKIYPSTRIYDILDEEFSEFIIEPLNIDEFFENYNNIFYDIPKTGRLSHRKIIEKSIKQAGVPYNSKLEDKQELLDQINDLQEDLDSIEEEHPFFKNGSVIQARNNKQLNYYMQSGRRRQINSDGAFKLIKKRAGKRETPNTDFTTPLDMQAITGILVGPPINNEEDLNIDILSINRFDERQFEEEYK